MGKTFKSNDDHYKKVHRWKKHTKKKKTFQDSMKVLSGGLPFAFVDASDSSGEEKNDQNQDQGVDN